MNEINAIAVRIKSVQTKPDQWCLVHNGFQVLALAQPGTTISAPASHTMLVGTKIELDAQITRLQLTPRPQPQWLPAPKQDDPQEQP